MDPEFPADHGDPMFQDVIDSPFAVDETIRSDEAIHRPEILFRKNIQDIITQRWENLIP